MGNDTRSNLACALDLLASMTANLIESHQVEYETCHEGDADLAGEAPEACSYCKDIVGARGIEPRETSCYPPEPCSVCKVSGPPSARQAREATRS
jgi:hypothetical protein